MTHNNQPVSALRQHMLEDMQLRKLSWKTQGAYIRAVKNFTRFLGLSPDSAEAVSDDGDDLPSTDWLRCPACGLAMRIIEIFAPGHAHCATAHRGGAHA